MGVLENKDRFKSLCQSLIKREGIENLLEWLEKTDFYEAPASTRFHGNYSGGLCEHSLNVFDYLRELSKMVFGDTLGDDSEAQETAAIISLFHDFCKIQTYKKGKRNVKNPDTGKWEVKEVYEFDELLPLGHGEKSCLLVQAFIKLRTEELLAIRWHMSGYDAAVKGGDRAINKAKEITPWVTLLQCADMLATLKEEIV